MGHSTLKFLFDSPARFALADFFFRPRFTNSPLKAADPLILIHLGGKCIPRGRRKRPLPSSVITRKKGAEFLDFPSQRFHWGKFGSGRYFCSFFSKFREGIHKEDRNVFLSWATVAFPRIEIFYFSPPPPSNPLTARCPFKRWKEGKHSQRDISPQTPLLFPHPHRPTRLLLLLRKMHGLSVGQREKKDLSWRRLSVEERKVCKPPKFLPAALPAPSCTRVQ